MTQLIPEKDKEIIKSEYWSKLTNRVRLIYFDTRREDCQYCSTIRNLYRELTDMSDLLDLDIVYFEDNPELAKKYEVSAAPTVVLKGANKGLLKFYGLPAGSEFPNFIDIIVKVSNGATDLNREIINKIHKIIRDKVKIKVFITPTCPYCPRMVSLVFQFAIVSEYVDAEAWEAVEFPEESRRYDVKAVPKTIINEDLSFEGLVSPEYLLHYIYHALYGAESK